jgi:hypothetical protein
MKRASLITLLCLSALSTLAQDARRLAALAQIESGNNDRAIGRSGEVSRYQIMPSVWHHYSRSRRYQDPVEAARVATLHLGTLAAYYRAETGQAATNFDLYVLWNTRAGYYARHGFDRSRIARHVWHRAQRFVNLVEG